MTPAEDRLNDALRRDDEAAVAELLQQAIEAPPARLQPWIDAARSIDRSDLGAKLLEASEPNAQRRFAALQLWSETGRAVAAKMAHLLKDAPADDPRRLQLAGALELEGDAAAAIAMLAEFLEQAPGWLAGQQALAQLRWTQGDDAPLASFDAAVAQQQQNEALHAAWLSTVKAMEAHDRLPADIGVAMERFGQSGLIAMVAADGYSELGMAQEADVLFGALAKIENPDFDATRARHAMRYGRPDLAARFAAPGAARHNHGECWAWLGAALRASDDPRSDWFHRGASLFAEHSIDLTDADRVELAAHLGALHKGSAPPLGQSPRGGTQTMGPLLKRREAPIIGLRRAVRSAVRGFIEALPPTEQEHPFLSRPRQSFRFEGSWSIRLRPQGHHVAHIHSHGWISSALYVDLPEEVAGNADRKGWLQIGAPPSWVKGAMPPIDHIEPAPLKLALFPSIFWHGTVPFDAGERLTVAFDVVPR
ncbi:MAG: hypothetical protein HKO13_08280 [Sphingomonas sp.]|nr:hypothetical protein [Sphingomonas sp.]